MGFVCSILMCFSRPVNLTHDPADFSDDSSESSDEEDQLTEVIPQPCRYYNSGGCRAGNRCPYLHVCKYAMRGNCRNGSNCVLSHDVTGGARTRAEDQAPGDTQRRRLLEEIAFIRCFMFSVSLSVKWLLFIQARDSPKDKCTSGSWTTETAGWTLKMTTSSRRSIRCPRTRKSNCTTCHMGNLP